MSSILLTTSFLTTPVSLRSLRKTINIFQRQLRPRVSQPLKSMMDRIYNNGVYEDPTLVLDDFDQIVEALIIFKKVFGDYGVSNKFEVPDKDPWPSHLHGLRLGKRLEKLLSSREFFADHQECVDALSKIGFKPSVDSIIDDWRTIIESLKVYKQLFGDVRVPAKYVIPNEDPWPRLGRKMKLGVRIAAIRSAGRYVKDRRERKIELDELGFEWRLRDHTHKQQVGEDLFDQILKALVHYRDTIDETMSVPVDYQVPEGEGWPEDTWGLQLGALVQSIRDKDKLVYGRSDREQKLNDIGFMWEETTRVVYSKKRFETVYSALVIYKDLYGDLFVPQAFVVPKTEEWPEEFWDLKLGARVNAIRAQGTLISNSWERRYIQLI